MVSSDMLAIVVSNPGPASEDEPDSGIDTFRKAVTSHRLTRYPGSLSLPLCMLGFEAGESPHLHLPREPVSAQLSRSGEVDIAKFTYACWNSLAISINLDTRTRRPAPSVALTVPVFFRGPSWDTGAECVGLRGRGLSEGNTGVKRQCGLHECRRDGSFGFKMFEVLIQDLGRGA